MAHNFAAVKAKMRRDVHASLSISATYQFGASTPEAVSVRWHNKISRFGDMMEAGYAEVVEGIERICFMKDEVSKLLLEKGVSVERGGVVTITAEGFDNARLILHDQEPIVGPVEIWWQVARE